MPALNHERDKSVNTNVMRNQHLITTVITIAERLKATRERLGLTQKQLATRAAVTQSAISNIENGTRKRPRDLVSIARALNIDPSWLESGKQALNTGVSTNIASEPTAEYDASSSKIEQALSVLEAALAGLDMQGRERIAPMFESFARAPGAVIKKDIAGLLQSPQSIKSQQTSLAEKVFKTR